LIWINHDNTRPRKRIDFINNWESYPKQRKCLSVTIQEMLHLSIT
jgi:hypothetical protein